MDHDTRIELAVQELKDSVAEELRQIEAQNAQIVKHALRALPQRPSFQSTAQPTMMKRTAGFLARGVAALSLTAMFSVIAAGQSEEGERFMHDAVCAIPLMECAPRQ